MLLSPVAAGRYLSGFGNGFATEALDGALPRDQNSPQRAPLGLYAEQLSGTAFTAPRAENRRSWLYRVRPPAAHGRYEPATFDRIRSAPLDDAIAGPNRLRWDATPLPAAATDFVDGLTTLAACGNVNLGCGAAVHVYAANRSMERRVFSNADGEMLFVPHEGALELVTELGRLAVAPGEMAVIPRGIRFRVELAGASARGYCCENYGALWRLPELGPIGANGLANARDFLTPVAAFEDDDAQTDVVHKYAGRLWRTQLAHSPLDVVAWHGNYAPYVYNLAAFNTINSVSYDHPDPSIFTVLTSPSDRPGTANVDFVVFPPRWTVAEHTFRPPWFHRNVMSEFMGLVRGRYDGKAGGGFVPGGASLHNGMSAHGPDAVTFERASDATLVPQRIDESLAIMFETALRLIPTAAALACPALQSDYDSVWNGLRRQFPGG